ncbi:MAG: hypothetical protein HRU17_18580 [Polyangiaceae bacterium]|nr:hypothetical protein [Polyangiaceae bacterium]
MKKRRLLITGAILGANVLTLVSHAVFTSSCSDTTETRPINDAANVVLSPRDGSLQDGANDAPTASGLRQLIDRSEGDQDFHTFDLMVTDDQLYWTESNNTGVQIMTSPLSGSPVTAVMPKGINGGSGAQAVDDEYVYSVNTETIRRVSLAGRDVIEISLGGASYFYGFLLVDDDALFVSSYGCSEIVRVPKARPDDIRTTVISESVSPTRGGGSYSTITETHVYCTGATNNLMVRLNKATGEYSVLVSGADQAAVRDTADYISFGRSAVSTEYVYWVATEGRTKQALYRLPLTGGTPDKLQEFDVSGINVFLEYDATRNTLYWTSGGGNPTAILRYDIAKGEGDVIQSDLWTTHGFAMDDDNLYWTTYGGIMTMPKP